MKATRRELLGLGVGGVTTVALGVAAWRELLGSDPAPSAASEFGYGPRGEPDVNGIRLPRGFRSRLIARGGEAVGDRGYLWHPASDGAATFPVAGGGWILVSNSEAPDGGASAIRFDPDGEAVDAYSILTGTSENCSGGGTPWGTWLSCEEIESGRVWECDPAGERDAVPLPALGVFKHEAAAVDLGGRHVYLTEDLEDGRLYRFTPDRWPDLGSGLLEVASVAEHGTVRWIAVPDPAAARTPTRHQVEGSTPFARGEGIWFDDGVLFIATTADNRVHAYDTVLETIDVIYDGVDREEPLLHVDQMTISPAGEIFVCEDSETDVMDIGLMARDGRVSKFLSIGGPEHGGSEPTGVTFDPVGRRMYFASQRAGGGDGEEGPGAVYEISGPFRRSVAR